MRPLSVFTFVPDVIYLIIATLLSYFKWWLLFLESVIRIKNRNIPEVLPGAFGDGSTYS